MSSRPKMLLLDANALLHRAWHAIPPLTTPEGMVVNAAYGMASVVLKLIKEEKPALFIACWDTEAPTFRHKAYKEYKATRKEQPDELYAQVPVAKETLETLGVKSVELDGFEADDLLGTLAVHAVKEGYDARVVTGDRDALQLIAPHVDVLTFKKGVSETKLYTKKEFEEEYGIGLSQFLDYKALRGDTSDNIPGVRGIGEKTAAELLKKFKTLDGIFSAAKNAKSDLTASVRSKLIEGEASGRQALTLVGIDLNVPLKTKLSDLKSSLDREAFIQAAAKYGFRSLITRLPREEGSGDRVQGTGTKVGKTKKAATSKSVSGENDIKSFLADLQKEKEISLVIASQVQESLFGGTGGVSIVIGAGENVAMIPASLVASVRRELTDVLASEQIGKICHDAKKAMKELEVLNLPLNGIVHDTLIAAYLLAAGERSLDLDTLTLQILGKPLPEGEGRAVAEAQAILAIAKEQRKQMKETTVDRVWTRFELPLIPVLRQMERTGILVDLPYLKKLSQEMTRDKQALEKKMEKLVGHPFNPASPSQLAVILFDELQLPTKGIKSGKTGYSTAASELEKLEGAHPLIALISEHRELAKLLSTYVDTLPTQTDAEGRIHTTFNQTIAATGRLSSSDPNLQNIPARTETGRRIRRAFIAPPGMELLSCDYSQIELRVIAALSGDKKMLEAFRSRQDIHTATAAAIWGIPIGQVTKDQRRAAKAINFGIIYGQGPHGLSHSADIPFADAKKFIEAYFATYTAVKEYLDTMRASAHQRGYVETVFGRRRSIPDIHSSLPQLRAAAERMAINMPAQGTAADLMKEAMISVAGALPKICADARMLLQVHDELLFEVPTKEVKRVAVAVKELMENVEKIGCPIVVDAKHGKNWEEMEALA